MMKKLLKFVLDLPERFRIRHFQAYETYQTARILTAVISQRRNAFFVFALVAVGSLIVDVRLFPVLKSTAVGAFFDSTDVIKEALAATFGGLATILGLLLTIFIFTFQLAAERYKYTDRMMRFFTEEQVGNIVLDFLTFSLLFSLWSLFLAGMREITPYVSIAITALAVATSVIVLSVYFKQALNLTQPSFIYRSITLDIVNRLQVLKRPQRTLGPSVENHIRRLVVDKLDLFQQFVQLFSTPEENPSAAEGMVGLLHVLERYVRVKRFIDPQSYWFPRKEVPMERDKDMTRRKIVTQAHLEAWGTPPETVMDHAWLENKLLSFTERIFDKAVKSDLTYILASIPHACGQVLEAAFEEQEFDILQSVASRALFPYFEKISEEEHPTAALELYRAIWQVCRKTIEDQDEETFAGQLTAINWHDRNKIYDLGLPKLFLRDLLALQEMIHYEIHIEGRRVTPDAWLERYCLEHSIAETRNKRAEVFSLCFSFLTTRIKQGVREGLKLQVRNALRTQITLLRQGLVKGHQVLYSAELEGVLDNLKEAVSILAEAARSDPSVMKEFTSETFVFLINMIHSRQLDGFRDLLSLYLVFYSSYQTELPDERQEANEQLIMLGSLALVYSEFYQSNDPIQAVLTAYAKAINLENFVKLLEIYLKNRSLTIPWIMKYDSYFRNVRLKIHRLPQVARREQGAIGFDTIPDHPSEFIRRVAHYGTGDPMRYGVKELYVRLCEIAGVELDEEALTRYS